MLISDSEIILLLSNLAFTLKKHLLLDNLNRKGVEIISRISFLYFVLKCVRIILWIG